MLVSFIGSTDSVHTRNITKTNIHLCIPEPCNACRHHMDTYFCCKIFIVHRLNKMLHVAAHANGSFPSEPATDYQHLSISMVLTCYAGSEVTCSPYLQFHFLEILVFGLSFPALCHFRLFCQQVTITEIQFNISSHYMALFQHFLTTKMRHF